jgi:hypothetical protein
VGKLREPNVDSAATFREKLKKGIETECTRIFAVSPLAATTGVWSLTHYRHCGARFHSRRPEGWNGGPSPVAGERRTDGKPAVSFRSRSREFAG